MDWLKEEVDFGRTADSPSICLSEPNYSLNLNIFRMEIKGE